MSESEEQLQSFITVVVEENENVGTFMNSGKSFTIVFSKSSFIPNAISMYTKSFGTHPVVCLFIRNTTTPVKVRIRTDFIIVFVCKFILPGCGVLDQI